MSSEWKIDRINYVPADQINDFLRKTADDPIYHMSDEDTVKYLEEYDKRIGRVMPFTPDEWTGHEQHDRLVNIRKKTSMDVSDEQLAQGRTITPDFLMNADSKKTAPREVILNSPMEYILTIKPVRITLADIVKTADAYEEIYRAHFSISEVISRFKGNELKGSDNLMSDEYIQNYAYVLLTLAHDYKRGIKKKKEYEQQLATYNTKKQQTQQATTNYASQITNWTEAKLF